MKIQSASLFAASCLLVLLSVSLGMVQAASLNKEQTPIALDAQSIVSGGSLNLTGALVDGQVVTGGSFFCRQCSIAGNVTTGSNLKLEDCKQVGHISSGGNADLRKIQGIAGISTGGQLVIIESTVNQDIHAGGQVHLENALVKGNVDLGGQYARLVGSEVTTIRFTGAGMTSSFHSSRVITDSRSGIVIGHGNSVVSGNGNSIVSVGTNSHSMINGYRITGMQDQTMVATPDQSVYINGLKVSGDGPQKYEDYRNENPGAPMIQGPGWHTGFSKREETFTPSKIPVNVLELKSNSTVHGDVVFESGYGVVKLYPGSELQGEVRNGTIEKAF